MGGVEVVPGGTRLLEALQDDGDGAGGVLAQQLQDWHGERIEVDEAVLPPVPY